ncbi:hypothetical protein [Escherichia coli]|uniref:hypothetical protein n=1 Tax=Escherichia coli TaxID=562 RepID=UPI003D9CB3F5
MKSTIADSTLPVDLPLWNNERLSSRIVHLGCGAFHRAHQALYTHHLLEQSDSDWGICEVNLMPGNDQTLIENLKNKICCIPWRKRRTAHRTENYRLDERGAAPGD